MKPSIVGTAAIALPLLRAVMISASCFAFCGSCASVVKISTLYFAEEENPALKNCAIVPVDATLEGMVNKNLKLEGRTHNIIFGKRLANALEQRSTRVAILETSRVGDPVPREYDTVFYVNLLRLEGGSIATFNLMAVRLPEKILVADVTATVSLGLSADNSVAEIVGSFLTADNRIKSKPVASP